MPFLHLLRSLFCFGLLVVAYHAEAKEDYLRYHLDILRCERIFLYEQNIPKALQQYRKVISGVSRPFAKDCFIALQLACHIKDKPAAGYFLAKAAERGVDWSAFERSSGINRMLQEDSGFRLGSKKVYDRQHKAFLRKINARLRAEVIRMKQMDDSFKLRTFVKQSDVREERLKDYRSILDSNTLNIVRLTQQYGFLGDDVVGYMDYSLDGTSEERSGFCYQLRSLIDQLYFHHGCCFLLLAGEMDAALKNGKVLPGMYALMYEWAHQSAHDERPEMALCNGTQTPQEKLYRFGRFRIDLHRTAFDTAFVEQCRAEIALPSLDHESRKKAFAKEHGIRTGFGMFDCY